ncbi:MAG: beta-galactosidase [Caulobacteraceae bacterium]|nr:beta-galactosidase [Caulobacteraceae bacterium]
MKTSVLAAAFLAATLTVVGCRSPAPAPAKVPPQQTLLFGVAYYDEYSPDPARLDTDVQMMKAAGINVVRIAESTWGTLETQDGKFDFSHVDRVLAAMQKAGIKVIVGTPTYAIPTWLAKEHPDVLVEGPNGRAKYGFRQNMDITNPEFRKQAQQVIVKLVQHVRNNPAVIGYQIDNETKANNVSGPAAQAEFVKRMRRQFPSLDALNDAFGLNYWSNRINSWEDFPSVVGAQNASLTSAYAQFQRDLVTEYLAWQSGLVRANARPDQFITQNFDLDWRGYSYGVRPEVDHFAAARALDVVGMDIYHPTQDKLTGAEIALGGDMARSVARGKNYLVIETQAQGFPEWTPYPGQLRLQAFSHLASGANMVAYWHWGTTANGFETYWRGLLGQDFKANPTYEEAKTIGADFARLGPRLVNMQKHNHVAVYVSNRAQTAFNAFGSHMGEDKTYNDAMRPFYDALYRMNVEVDFVDPTTTDLSAYKLIVVPSLYAASDAEIARLNAFAKAGGQVFYTFKSGFSDENVKVRYTSQPGGIAQAAGIEYSQFTLPENVGLKGDGLNLSKDAKPVRWWMELLQPTTAQVLATYDHPIWGRYAAVTRNKYGAGEVTYVGFMPSDDVAEKLLAETVQHAGLVGPQQSYHYPIIVRSGVLNDNHAVNYVLNYAATPAKVPYRLQSGTDLLSGRKVNAGAVLDLPAWGVAIIEADS